MLNSGNASQMKDRSLADIAVLADVIEEKHSNRPASQKAIIVNNMEQRLEKITDPEIAALSDDRKIRELGKKSGRLRWTDNQKKTVLKFFKTHVTRRTAPKKNECLKFLELHPDLFVDKDWMRIKTLVYNTYRNT